MVPTMAGLEALAAAAAGSRPFREPESRCEGGSGAASCSDWQRWARGLNLLALKRAAGRGEGAAPVQLKDNICKLAGITALTGTRTLLNKSNHSRVLAMSSG